MTQEALKLALEVNESMKDVLKQVNELIAENKALKEALAQPAQEPVAGTKTWFEDGKVVTQYLTAKDIYKEPAQEPVAKYSDIVSDGGLDPRNKFDAQPPQRPWVGLTEKEKKEIYILSVYVEGAISLTEAKLKEKNNG